MKHLTSVLAAFLCSVSSGANVVINEIFYHAPEEAEELEYVELHNPSDAAVDLSGWRFSEGIKFNFPAGTSLPGQGYLVLCRGRQRFTELFNVPVFGQFRQKLKNSGELLELRDAAGVVVDQVEYSDHAPWPQGPDGVSGSLERICPTASGENPFNWSSSPLSADRTRPSGTAGKRNASYSAELPPVIREVKIFPENPGPLEGIRVQARVEGLTNGVRATLLYRALSMAEAGIESAVRMTEVEPGLFAGMIPGQKEGQLLRYRVGVRTETGATRFYPGENEPRPAESLYIASDPLVSKIPLGWIIAPADTYFDPRPRRWRGPWRGGGAEAAAPHTSAFVYYDPEVKRFEIFDFVQVASRPGGWKVRFGKGQSLREMTTVNLTFENERGAMVEALAYEVYRRCGMAAEQSWHVRVTLNGQPIGYHLLFEQPNRAFLRRNGLRDDGNLYKILWYEQGVVGQHEKKTNLGEGHEDIVSLVEALQQSEGEAQWEVIQKNFDLKQVATYFAVNTVLSHWDGFFNNYLTYHDVKGSGKWTMYPWDQDQTWGIINGAPGWVFHDMPLTFGMAGDQAPGERRGAERRGRRGFGHGPMWWRPGGYFSAPLLANERFRVIFLARIREILTNVYTAEKMDPLIDSIEERLREEVKLRAEWVGGDARHDLQEFERNIRALREHVVKRREFLLAQPELAASNVLLGP